MSLISRLVDLVSEAVNPEPARSGDPSGGDERTALAALLVHVARVDGQISAPEQTSLIELISGRFGLTEGAARSLVSRADALDREIDDVADLIEMLGHGLDRAAKRDLLGLAYRVAAADGGIGEFEDDLVWRVGHLLGLDEAAIAEMRNSVVAPG